VTLGNDAILRASQWCYAGVWGLMTQWFRVPADPPSISGAEDQSIRSFRPAEGFLRYLKFFFWIGLVAIDSVLTIAWLVVLFAVPWLGILLAPLAWAIIILPDIAVYIGIHLRYDTTWYVLTDRSMRIRRGIWTIHETTITYENIQNVSVRQGPLQRYFGISDVVVETAGGGGAAGAHGEGGASVGHFGLLEGIDNATEVRDLIMAKWRTSRSAGVGDDPLRVSHDVIEATIVRADQTAGWNEEHVAILHSIRDLAANLADR
jgi:membrane protein YdbS with pleckstrin-like domain